MYEHTVLTALSKNPPATISEIARQVKADPKIVRQTVQWFVDIGLPIKTSSSGKLTVERQIVPIDAVKICQIVATFNKTMADRIGYFPEINSTNEYLLESAHWPDIHQRVCIAEYMTHGRGRRRRKWIGSAYEDIFISIAWKVGGDLNRISGLSLAVATFVIESLRSFTDEKIQLKWPNDLLWNKRKLGGILVETQDEVVVIGIGINCRLSAQQKDQIHQPVTSLLEITGIPVDRTELIGSLLYELHRGLHQFFTQGLSPFVDAWENAHAYRGQWISVDSSPDMHGKAIGIDSRGSLLLQRADGTISSIHSGEVSLLVAGQGKRPD